MAWLVSIHTGASGFLLVLAAPTMVLAAGAAGYSAFLFGQAEGRDFWQSPILLPHLLVAAVMAGAATLLIVSVFVPSDVRALNMLSFLVMASPLFEATLLFAELRGSHGNVDVARAVRLITRGSLRGRFWYGVVVAGIVLPFIMFWAGGLWSVLGACLALAGLWIYEDAWVKAGQSIPLS